MTDPISARLREDVFYGEERMIKFGKHNPLHMEAADHIDAQAATIKALTDALGEIAKQKTTGELTRNEWDTADFMGGYDQCIQTARAALAAAKGPK